MADHPLREYLAMLVQAYNPDRYVHLMTHPWHKYVKFFFATLAVALLLFMLTFIPIAVKEITTLPATFQSVSQFELNANVQAEEQVIIFDEPSVALDLAENRTRSKHDIMITRAGIEYPEYIFFGSEFIRWEDIADLKQPTPERDRMLVGIMVFLLPSILFWFALVSVLKLFATFLLLVPVGYYLPRLFKHRISFAETVKTAVLAMPSVMMFGVGLSPLVPGMLFWWGLLLTLVVYAIGITLLSERTGTKYKR